MNDILVECPKCGWVHFAVNEKYVKNWEEEWKHYFDTKPKDWLAAYGITDAPPTRDQYLQCFRCGNKEISTFFITEKDLNGHTIQPILWESK
jgi:predicted nucleic-acid-binding Zn-ribbon protein